MPEEERNQPISGADEDAKSAGGPPEPNEELDVVFTTNDDSEALAVRGLLESNGFEVAMNTPQAPIGVFPITAGDLGSVNLLVRAELAEEARRLIADSLEGGAEDADEAERETEV